MPRYRNDVIVLCLFICLRIDCCLGMHRGRFDLQLEEVIDELPQYHDLECEAQVLKSEEGIYSYVSDGRMQFCSLYIVAPIDNLVEFEFTAFDVSCDGNGAVGLLDGWEVDQDFFPADEDHSQPFSHRYVQFCDGQQPTGRYVAKQNVAQLQFYVPIAGEGFHVRVSFKHTKKPCNMLLMGNNFDNVVMKNYGLKRNCSVLSFFPQEVTFTQFDVGERRKGKFPAYDRSALYRVGLRATCREGRSTDRIEVYKGVGVGQGGRTLALGFCGRRYRRTPLPITLACESTTVRLVSGGNFFNSVVFNLSPVEPEERSC